MKFKNWHVSTDYDSWCQEHLLKTEIDLTAPWNAGSRPPIEDWLAHSQSPEDRQRLTCMGNIVVPLQAKHALSLLSEIQANIQAWNRPPICWQWLLCRVVKSELDSDSSSRELRSVCDCVPAVNANLFPLLSSSSSSSPWCEVCSLIWSGWFPKL